jgi:hypothetical protein
MAVVSVRCMCRTMLTVVTLVGACKGGKPTPQNSEASVPARAESDANLVAVDGDATADTAQHSQCRPLPPLEKGDKRFDTLDLDGDGTNDVAIGPSVCASEECPHALYLERGTCFEFVGRVVLLPELLATKHNGLFDLGVTVHHEDGATTRVIYEFDTKTYVMK